MQAAGEIDDRRLGTLGDADKDVSFGRQDRAGGQLAFGERQTEPRADAHHFARATHLGAEHDVDAGELDEREDAFFYRDMTRHRIFSHALLGERHAGHHFGGDFGDRHPGRLGNKRYGAAGAWVDFDDVDNRLAVFFFHGKLHVHQADDA